MSEQIILRPDSGTARGPNCNFVTIGATPHEAVDEVVADDGTTATGNRANEPSGCPNTAWQSHSFFFPTASAIPLGSRINSVSVLTRHRGYDGSGSDPGLELRVELDGNVETAIAAVDAWTDRTRVFTTDPDTGNAWEIAELDNLEARLEI